MSNSHADLMLKHQQLVELAFLRPLGLQFDELFPENEGAEYAAARAKVSARTVCFRVSKITPTKNGQFVTLWKRPAGGRIVPLAVDDNIDFVMISVIDGDRYGLFLFPRDILIAQGIFSSIKYPGKLAIRVYPAWIVPESKQAAASQLWQNKYFFERSAYGVLQQQQILALFGA